MRWALLLVACGCNPVFGIDQTELWRDAAPAPDAPPPPVCPAVGGTPAFGSELNQISARDIVGFHVVEDTSLAAGMTYDTAVFYNVPVIGQAGSQLQPMQMKPPAHYATSVRFAPEGDTLFITSYDYSTGKYPTGAYQLVDGTWTLVGNGFVPDDTPYAYTLSAPTKGPVRRFLTEHYNPTTYVYDLIELEYDGSTATVLSRDAVSAFGADRIAEINLSADGLRAVFVKTEMWAMPGTTGDDSVEEPPQRAQPVMYMDRATLADKFSAPRALESVPDFVAWPQLSEDCGRIYFGALNTAWYLKLAQ